MTRERLIEILKSLRSLKLPAKVKARMRRRIKSRISQR